MSDKKRRKRQGRIRDVSTWTGANLAALPSSEDDEHEYKSSQSTKDQIAKYLGKAASGFWNTGGGLFVVGVDGNGKPDGGIGPRVGRQSRRDWVDQVVLDVEPSAEYVVGSVALKGSNRIVLVVEFLESHLAPHMAPDRRYYVRAGAHTVPARHGIVEALRARRGLLSPVLRIIYRLKPENPQAVQLGLVVVNDAPALDVELEISPLPDMWKDVDSPFPLKIGVVDQRHPFFMDLTTWTLADQRVGKGVVGHVRFRDLAGVEYKLEEEIKPTLAVSPWRIGTPLEEKIDKSLEKIAKAAEELARRARSPGN